MGDDNNGKLPLETLRKWLGERAILLPLAWGRLVKGPAVGIAFTDIKWPTDIVLPWEKKVPPPKTELPSDLDKRITAYLEKIPGAISGENGHGQTFSVACQLVNGWGLNAADAMRYLKSYNQGCNPPWTDKEPAHKISDARRARHVKIKGHLIGSKVSLEGTQHDCPYPPANWSEPTKHNGARGSTIHPSIRRIRFCNRSWKQGETFVRAQIAA